MMIETKDQGIRTTAGIAIAAHILQVLIGLSRLDVDGLFLRRMAVIVPLIPLLLAAAEIGALLVLDVLMACGKKRGGRKWLIWWTLCVILSLVWAFYPVPRGDVITYQADKVVFGLLPVGLLTPQVSLQLIWYSVLPLLREAAGEWLLQYGGAVFCGAQLVYGCVLPIRERKCPN